ncbi:probable 26S proteasome regulatory subunit p27 [Diutina catenulata]
MTLEPQEFDEGETKFRGLMKSLNLDESQLPPYRTDFEDLPFGQLSTIKQSIEQQLGFLFDLLHKQYHSDMDSPLTIDGYPRSDVDVMNVRLIRVKIIRLRNDNKALMKVLEGKLVEEFARKRDEQQEERQENKLESLSLEEPEESSKTAESVEYRVPFARVYEVVVDGPAYTSGLRDEDQIVLFDSEIHAANHNRLQNLVKRVAPGRQIPVVVMRQDERVELTLEPRANWGGRGVLGCRVLSL